MYIKCNYSPSYLTKNDFSWTSTNPSVVRVYWDKIRGLKPGTAEIIIKSLDNSTEKRIKITVKQYKKKCRKNLKKEGWSYII